MITNIASLVEANAATMPDRLAVVDDDRRLTYREMALQTDAMAAVLGEHGVGRGDRVAVRMGNRSEFLTTSFAAWSLGAITVPVNTRLHGEEVRYILDHAGAACVVTEASLDGPDGVGHHRASRIVVDQLSASTSPSREGSARLRSCVTSGAPIQRLMYTSGTTSRPKAVVITHQMVVHNFLAQIRDLGLTADDRVLVPGPLFHVAAFDAPGIATLFLGGALVLQRRFDPDAVLRTIDSEQITGTVLVHPMGERLAEAAAASGTHDSLLWLSVGARSPEVARRLSEAFPNGRLVQGYGLTEACGPVTSRRDRMDKHGTAGSPVPYVEVTILDDHGRELPCGQPGEIAIRGPKVTPGYWDRSAPNRDHEDWLPTGDVGVLDADGFLTLVDRKKDMIRSGGENVASSEIERVLSTHPAVRDVAVVAAPHAEWGEVPIAFVVVEPDVASADFATHCAAHLAKFKVPREYRIVEALPRNATGKVEKVKLRRLVTQAIEAARTGGTA